MKIKTALIIILILLSTVPILLSHLLTYSEEKKLHHYHIIAKLNDIATLQHKRIEQLFKNHGELVTLIASQTQLKQLTKQYQHSHSTKDSHSLLKILDATQYASPKIKSLSILSINQVIIASTALEEQTIKPQVFNESNQKLLNIRVLKDKNNQLTINFTKKLYINNEHIGYLFAEFSNIELLSIISDYTGLGRTGEMVLIARDSNGNSQFVIPTRHNKNPSFTFSKSKLDILTSSSVNGKSTTLYDYLDYRSVLGLAINRYIPEVDWHMIIKIDHQEVFEQLDDLQTLMTELVFAIIALAVVLSLFIGKKFSEPVLALEKIVLGIIKGHTKLRANTSKLVEINRLGNSINTMVSSQLDAEKLLHDAVKKLTNINKQINSESERFKRWKESNFIGILHSDENGKIIDANSTLLNMLGYNESDLLDGAIDWQKLTPKEFKHLDIAAIKEAEKKGFWTPFEKEYIHKDGHRVPILIGGSMFKYDTKEFIVFIIDLTTRNQQLDALEKYKHIIESSTDLIAYIDKSYQFKLVNQAYCEYYELTKEQIENHSLSEVLGKALFLEEMKSSVDKTLSGSIIKFTETFNFKGLGKRLISVTYTPFINDDCEVMGIIFWGEDITELDEQRQLTQAIKIEHEQVINSMLEGVLTTDSKGVILTFNPEAENIFGYAKNEAIGKNISILVPKNHAHMHDNYLSAFLNGKSSNMVGNRQGRTVMATHKDKHEFPLRISIAQLPKDRFSKANFIANFQDLTESERQREMLNRSLRMESLGKVASGVAHDFNNILGIITGYCSLLQAKLSSEKENRYLSSIAAASDRGANLTKNLLTFSKNQSTAITLLSINEIILANKEMLETLLTSQISLQLTLDQALLLTSIDRNLFEDLLLNMSINAMHAMPNGGVLHIKTENSRLCSDDKFDMPFQAGQYVKITIEDNGCGMSKEICSHLFEPFFTTKGNIGNGLGLSQCYGFVTSSKGVITVDSIPNKGSLFSIYLPISRDKKSAQQLPIITENKSPLKTSDYTILIVDDEEQILELNSEVLNDVGFTVFSFNNAKEALAFLSTNHIDVIVTDVVMPEIGGVEFINEAKLIAPAVKHLFVSGYLGESSTTQQKKVAPLLNKPYTRKEFISAIEIQCCYVDK